MLSGYLSLSRRSATAPPSGGAINRLRTGGSSWDVFRFRARNRRRSADEEKLLRNTSCSGGQDPYRICGNCVHTVMRRLSPAASWPSPLGKVPSLSRRMRACRQLAQHSAIFCFAQSLIRRYAPASPKGSLRTHRASCSSPLAQGSRKRAVSRATMVEPELQSIPPILPLSRRRRKRGGRIFHPSFKNMCAPA